MFGLPLPLVLLLWPLSMTFAQSLTTPSASLSSISLASLTSSRSLAPSASSSGSANASLSASATSSASFPSLSGYSPCVVQCLGLSISQVGCNSIVDVQCFCTNATRFSRAIVNCVSSECPTDLTAAESVSQQFCNVASPNVSLSFPSPTASQTSDPSSSRPSSSQSLTSSPVSSSGSSQSSSSASSSSPSTSQSGTSGAIGTFGQTPALGMAIVFGWCLAVLGWVTMW